MSDAAAMESACQRLVQMSAKWIDEHRFEDVSRLFAENGSFQRANGDILEGRDAIACGLDRPSGHLTIHHVSPTLVEILTPENARGTTSFVAYLPAQETGGSVVPVVAAFWDDRFIRRDRGWLIAERRTRVLTKSG